MNKETAKKEFASNVLITSEGCEYNAGHSLDNYKLNIAGNEADIKEFKRLFGTPTRENKFIDMLDSIAKGFDGGSVLTDDSGRRYFYFLNKCKRGFSCEFEKVPTPVDKWLKILSEEFPSLEFTFSRSFHSNVYIGFENGIVAEENIYDDKDEE